jgi:hypothetical protein
MNHCARWLYFFCFSLLLLVPIELRAQADPCIVPPGLEKQVEFWKRIFTEHSFTQLVFFDPQDMGTIYEVMEVGEDNRSNEYINGERSRIAATYGVSVERVYAAELAQIDLGAAKDPKTRLQEWLQARRLALPEYAIVAVNGEAHVQSFDVMCRIPGMGIEAQGSGPSRRAAEQAAATSAYEQASSR